MNFSNIPSKAEVMGWNPQTLADYMRKLKLSGCDRVVTKSSIDGAQFMNMTECDLQMFPCLFVPIITKIKTEINKEEHKKASSHKSKPLKYPKQDKVFVQEEDVWESDEFDNESDDPIYEGPEHEAENYNCSVVEQQPGQDKTSEAKYKQPAAGDPAKPPRPPRGPKPPDCQREPLPDPALSQRTSKPPLPSTPRGDHILQRPLKPAVPASVHIDRSKKPGSSQKDIPKIKGSAVKDTISKFHHPKVPVPTDVSNRPSKLIPEPSIVTQSTEEYNSTPRLKKGLDSSWYGGKLTRHQAEAALREVNKDGAFVVRDSSKASVEHPFTLMLLYQDKVYNIKIRHQGNGYTLGSGLKNTKSFPGVKELITHHTHTPLQLIDATDQSHEEHPQSCLLHPTGH
ncbi:lymphocyte cytosolic protein 2 [Oreochromis niloticus]|uniref:Lymphocyte cytosolic protein 2b n=1 Tax=Oreochromis niloticus TaxID=8128 RepID=I3KM70_ORENI|nr:lymphocyte cytosolic protein 2 [Oreochromis niloticus]